MNAEQRPIPGRRPGAILPGGLADLPRTHQSQPVTASFVIPVINEADNLRQVLPTVPAGCEVVVVDGGSTDGSMDVVREVRPDAVVLRQTRWGKGNALACGFAKATGDIIVMFDADGSADAREAEAFVATLLAGADFAKGTRFVPGGGSVDITVLRRMGNWFFAKAANQLFGMRFTDLCYGYNAFWRDVLPLLDLPDPEPVDGEIQWGDGFEVETVINCRAAAHGLVIREVPSHERHRLHGPSNLRAWPDGLRVLRTLLREWRARDTSVGLTAAVRHFSSHSANQPAQRTAQLATQRATP